MPKKPLRGPPNPAPLFVQEGLRTCYICFKFGWLLSTKNLSVSTVTDTVDQLFPLANLHFVAGTTKSDKQISKCNETIQI